MAAFVLAGLAASVARHHRLRPTRCPLQLCLLSSTGARHPRPLQAPTLTCPLVPSVTPPLAQLLLSSGLSTWARQRTSSSSKSSPSTRHQREVAPSRDAPPTQPQRRVNGRPPLTESPPEASTSGRGSEGSGKRGRRRGGSEAQRALNRSIMDASGVTQLAEIVDKEHLGFNSIHVAAALSKLARLGRGRGREGAEVRRVVERLEAHFRRGVGDYGGRELAVGLHSLVKLELGRDATFRAVAGEVLGRGSELSSRDVANLAWSFARAGRGGAEGPLMCALRGEAIRQICDFGPHELSTLAWAFANGGDHSPALFYEISTQAAPLVQRCNAHTLATLLWAFAHGGYRSATLFQAALPTARLLLREFSAQEMTMVLWAYAETGHRGTPLFEDAAKHIVRADVLQRSSPQGVAMLAWAYATARHEAPELLSALVDNAAARSEEFSNKDLITLTWAAAALGSQRPVALFDALSTRPLTSATPHMLATLAHAGAKLGHGDPNLYTNIQSLAYPRLRDFPPHQLATLAWACAKVGAADAAFFSAVAKRAEARLPDFGPRWLPLLLWSFAVVRPPGQRGGMALFGAARASLLEGLPAYSLHDLSMTAWAYARAGELDHELCMEIQQAARGRLREFSPVGLASLLWAFGTARFRSPTLWADAAPIATCQVDRLSPQGMAVLAWAYASAQQPSPELFRALSVAAEARVSEFSAQGLSMLLWAFARLQHPAPALFDAAHARVVPALADFDTQSIVMMSWAFESVAYPAPSLMTAVPARSRMYGGGATVASVRRRGLGLGGSEDLSR